MTTSPVNPTSPTGSSAAVPTNPSGVLGKDDFLKLMIAQLQSQDPLQPTDSSAYLGQLAQFTELEQITNLTQTSTEAAGSQQIAQAVALIGHTVSYIDPAGTPREGDVQNVQITTSGATLTVAGAAGIAPTSITEVS